MRTRSEILLRKVKLWRPVSDVSVWHIKRKWIKVVVVVIDIFYLTVIYFYVFILIYLFLNVSLIFCSSNVFFLFGFVAIFRKRQKTAFRIWNVGHYLKVGSYKISSRKRSKFINNILRVSEISLSNNEDFISDEHLVM